MTEKKAPKGYHYHVNGGGLVADTATVAESARISDKAEVFGNARISGNTEVYGNVWVCGNARIYGNAWVGGDVCICGNARIYGNARLYGNSWVYGNARICGNARIYGDAQVYGDVWKTSPLYIQGSRNAATNCKYGFIQIGCICLSFAEWKKCHKEIGKENGYTPAQIKEYKKIIDLFLAIGK